MLHTGGVAPNTWDFRKYVTSALRIVYLSSAKRDLERLRNYLLANDVSNEKVNDIILKIINSNANLAMNPSLGFSIGGRFAYDTPYRGYLSLAGRYVSIYKIIDNMVEIRRVYSTHENYIRDLIPAGEL